MLVKSIPFAPALRIFSIPHWKDDCFSTRICEHSGPVAGDIIFYQFNKRKVEQGFFSHFLSLYAFDKLPAGRKLRQMELNNHDWPKRSCGGRRAPLRSLSAPGVAAAPPGSIIRSGLTAFGVLFILAGACSGLQAVALSC